MKQKIKQLQSLLLLLILTVVGTANAWADTASWKNNSMSPASYFTLGTAMSTGTDPLTINSVSYTHSIAYNSSSGQSNNNTNGNYIRFTVTSASNYSIVFRASGGSRTIRLNTGWSYSTSSNAAQLSNGATPSDGIIATSSEVANGTAGTLSGSNLPAGTYYICCNGAVKVYEISITPAGGSTRYTVTFNGNSHGTPASSSLTEESVGAGVTPPAVTPASGYTFADTWHTSATCTDDNKVTLDEGKYKPSSNITLYAGYKYKVTFDANGGTCGTSNLTQTAAGASIALPDATKPSKVLTGWNIESDGSGTDYGTTSFVPTDNVTLHAQWGDPSSTKFQFVAKTSGSSLKLDGSSSEVEITTSNNATTLTGGRLYYTSVSEQECKSGIVLSTANSPEYLRIALGQALANGDVITTSITGSKDGRCLLLNTTSTYDGDGPRTSTGNSGTYTVTDGDGLAGATELYIWRGYATKTCVLSFTITGTTGTTYTVTYNGNGNTGGTVPDAASYAEDATVTVKGNTGSLTKTNYTFAGWNTANDESGTKYVAGSTFTMGAENVNLYAVWKHKVDLAVDDEAKGSVSAKYGTGGDTYYSKLANDDFTSGDFVSHDVRLILTATPNAGYEFDSAYEINGVAHPWGAGTGETGRTPTVIVGDNKVYTAHFRAKTYTITLDKGTGGATDGSVTATYNSNTLTGYSAALKAGSDLTGYFTAATGGVRVMDEDGNLIASVSGYTDGNGKWIKTDVDSPTLYAQWETVYTVTFDATTNEGTCATASLTQASDGASIILPAATKENCTFNGWYTAPTGGTHIGGTAGTYAPTSNITLYAQFSDPVVSTTKFHFLSKTSTDNINGTVSVTTEEGNYAEDLDGGTLKYFSDGSRDYKYGLKLGSNAGYLQINLSSALANGDVITFDQGTGTNQISFTRTSTRSTTPATSGDTYTVTAGDGLAGSETLYVWRASGSTTYVKELTIMTAGSATSTYSVAFDTAGIADEIETLTEQTALPNPLPTPTNVTDGYTFEGWYTNSTFTTRATAGAAIAANTTLYANYIIDTPVITPVAGAYPAKTTMTLTSSVPFTQAYGGWTEGSAAYSHSTLLEHGMYNGEAIDVFSGFTTPAVNSDSQHFTYMVSDGTFFSEPAVTEAYTVSNVITISVHPQNATYVVGGSATALTVVAADTDTGATLSYQWEVSNDNSSWGNVGTNSASYTPVITTEGTKYYRVTVSSNKSVDPVVSNVATITVNAAAAFTVSFDSGVGCDDEFDDETQEPAGASISLPSITVDASKYQFVGWYLDGVKVANADATTYTPSGNVTLVAKYNCKVVLERGAGEGNVPTAVIKGTSTTVASGDFVFEGTTLTLTASPADKFVNWSNGMTGTDNPKDYMVNAYKRFVANYVVPEYKKLFHTTFTESGWSDIARVNGGGTATGVGDDTYAPHNVTMKCGSGISYDWTSGTLALPGKNYDSENYIAIPVTGVNGELTITVANGSNKTQFKYNVVLGSSTDNPGSSTSTTANKPSTVTVKGLTASNYVVYIGRQSGSYAKYTEITITTPNTKLAADSAQVRIMKTAPDTPTATVHITTNSSGAVSIKTAPNESIATAAYSEGVLTITPKGAGTTSVVMQVAARDDYTARELTIPITVQVPTITINTQPSNIVCYQNDAADKTFTVVATVNTGNELTYQWYRNTAASTTGPTLTAIPGATSATYTLNTFDKATTGTNYYYFCEISSADCDDVYTNVVSVTVSALTAGTYNANVFVGSKGGTLTYTGLGGGTKISSDTDTGHTYYNASISSGTLTITGNSVGTGTITLSNSVIINVTVKKHTVQLIWSAEKAEYDVTGWSANRPLTIDDGSHPENLPYLTRLYEDGTPYTGTVTFYIDDTSMAYFNSPGTDSYTQTTGVKPNIYYAGGQGGCKFYAYIGSGDEVEPVKASYDLRLKRGYSNDLPSGRKVEVQQQYTLWKNATDKLITVTYGGYKYNDHKWDGKADSWGTATNYVGKDNAIDGYLYAVRNKDRDAKDEYKHAVQEEDDFGSAWYASGEGGTSREYQRIKPFRLPCRASYITFTAHATGTLTAYVYQNGIIGRGTGAGNQLASAPRLGYWFDEEGWVQEPANTVVTKQVIQKGNARDQRSYGGYANMDAQLDGYWKDAADDIVKTKLRSRYCKVVGSNNADDYEEGDAEHPANYSGDFKYDNPYYWGTATEVENNLAKVVPTPEHPIPHQGGYMIVNEGYVKYTIPVVAGKTYYFFGKMTKVGYAGMTFVEAAETREASLTLNAGDTWSDEKFGTTEHDVIYNEVTVPSNYRIGKWNTICLPFAVNENQVEEVFGKGTELAIFNGLRHDVENNIYYIRYLRHVDQNILPGQPYLIYPTGRAVAERTNQENGGMAETGENVPTVNVSGSGEDYVIGTGSSSDVRLTFKNVMIKKGVTAQSYGSDTDAGSSTKSFTFIGNNGTEQNKYIAKYDLYIAPKKGTLNRYMPSNPDAKMTLNTYHAFVQAQTSAVKQDAITFAFSEDDIEKAWDPTTWRSEDDVDPGEATGIVIIEDVTDGGNYSYAGRATNGKTYNLMGQEIDPRSAKGIVISNGKKIMY